MNDGLLFLPSDQARNRPEYQQCRGRVRAIYSTLRKEFHGQSSESVNPLVVFLHAAVGEIMAGTSPEIILPWRQIELSHTLSARGIVPTWTQEVVAPWRASRRGRGGDKLDAFFNLAAVDIVSQFHFFPAMGRRA